MSDKNLRIPSDYEFTVRDCKVCMRNAERLLGDAYSNVSIETKMALIELAFEETAKSILIFYSIFSTDRGQVLLDGDIDKNLREAFWKHDIKINAMKGLLTFFYEGKDEFDNQGLKDFLPQFLKIAAKGESKSSKKTLMDSVDVYTSKEGYTSLKGVVFERIIKFLEQIETKEYNDLKNASLYAGYDPTTGKIELPHKPKEKKILDYLTLWIFSALALQWEKLGEKERIQGLIEKCKHIFRNMKPSL